MVLLFITLILSACNASRDLKTIQSPIEQKPPGFCNKVNDPSLNKLERSIKISNEIFLGKVVKLDPYIWNTPDGKAPNNPCSSDFDPFIPIHIQVLETFKGSLAKNSEVTFLINYEGVSSPPLNLPIIYINPGDEIIWFSGKVINYRITNPANPLNYPDIIARYEKEDNGWNHYAFNENFSSIDELKSLIQKASTTQNPTNANMELFI